VHNSVKYIYLFISLIYMFRASMCTSSGEKLLYLCNTGICHSVWVASGLLIGLKQSDKYHCRKDTAIFLLMMSTWMPETCREEK